MDKKKKSLKFLFNICFLLFINCEVPYDLLNVFTYSNKLKKKIISNINLIDCDKSYNC